MSGEKGEKMPAEIRGHARAAYELVHLRREIRGRGKRGKSSMSQRFVMEKGAGWWTVVDTVTGRKSMAYGLETIAGLVCQALNEFGGEKGKSR